MAEVLGREGRVRRSVRLEVLPQPPELAVPALDVVRDLAIVAPLRVYCDDVCVELRSMSEAIAEYRRWMDRHRPTKSPSKRGLLLHSSVAATKRTQTTKSALA